MSQPIRELVLARSAAESIAQVAESEGMRRLHLDGLDKVKAGQDLVRRGPPGDDGGLRCTSMRRLTQERGFTIVEMMFAVVVLLVGALGTLAMLDTANKRSRGAAGPPERHRARPPGGRGREGDPVPRRSPRLDRQPGCGRTARSPAVSGDPWQDRARQHDVHRRRSSVCWLDEPADGLGSRAPGNFCPGTPAPAGRADGNSIDHKRVTVVTSWNNDAGKGSVAPVDPGLGARRSRRAGRRVGLAHEPGRSPITDPKPPRRRRSRSRPSEDAAAVVWSLDGTQQDTAGWCGRRLDLHLGAAARSTGCTTSPRRLSTRPASAARCARRPSSSTASCRLRRRRLAGARAEQRRRRDSLDRQRRARRDRLPRVPPGGERRAPRSRATSWPRRRAWTRALPRGPAPCSTTGWSRSTRTRRTRQREGAAVQPRRRERAERSAEPAGRPDPVEGRRRQQRAASGPRRPCRDPDGDPIESYMIYRDGTAIADRYRPGRGPPRRRSSTTTTNGVASRLLGHGRRRRVSPSRLRWAGDRMSRLRNEDGFTLAELLVGAMLMIIVMSASLGVLDNLRRLGAAHGPACRASGPGPAGEPDSSRASLRNVAPSPEFPAVIERAERVRPGVPHGRPPAHRHGRQRPQPEAGALLPRRERSGSRQAARADTALEHADRACHAVRDGVSRRGLGLVAARRRPPHEPLRRHRPRAVVVQPGGHR